jgi:hypothetical protein
LLILRLPSLPSHQFWNKKLITLLILYSQSPKILKQSYSLSYKPCLVDSGSF